MTKTFLAAAATAATLAFVPGSAFAVTAPDLDNIVDGGITTLLDGGFHSFRYTEDETAGGVRAFNFEFTADSDLTANTAVSVNAIPAGGITGLFVRWLAADGSTVLASWDGSASPFATSIGASETRYLAIGWDSSVQGGDMNVNIQSVAAVPLPAGVLLLGTALVAAGAGLRRRSA